MVLIDWGIPTVLYRNNPLADNGEANQKAVVSVGQKAAQLLAVLVVFTMFVSLLQYWHGKDFLFFVVLFLVPFCFGWALFARRLKRYATIAFRRWKERTKGLVNYFFMFLGAGLFVEKLSHSSLLDVLAGWFHTGTEHAVWLYAMIAAYFFVTSFIGFHPLVSLTLLMPLLKPIISLVPTVPLSIVLICCSLSTVMHSPYNISVSLLADELGVNPYRVGRWNISLAIAYMAEIGVAVVARMLFHR
ncbi:hypothetical protein [Geobacillus thermodenitrificans]|uniref:hypothetical protein n=1 Tax=Geobacillus thermodenitrificans TaxID=33940 RepID=UPI00017E6F3A